MKKLMPLFVLIFLISSSISSQVLYNADFSTDGDGFPDHNTANPPAEGPASEIGGISPDDWTASYTDTPSTDGSFNEFKVDGGQIHIQDWGGTASLESMEIDISNVNFITITATGATFGGNVQNAVSEFFEYFYFIDGIETIVEIILDGSDTSGDPVDLSTATIDVTGANILTVGFRFNVNGGGDGYDISAITVEEIVLPVDFTKFNATNRTNRVKLAWQTASEINNDRFEIERSTDAVRYETIGAVKGNGNSLKLNDYTFEDESPLTGINYYRLKQIDIDGRFEYSDMVSVEMDRSSILIIPTSTYDFVTVNTEAQSSIILRSVNGQVMNQQSNSEGNFTVEMAHYPQGIYYLTINMNGSIQTEKVVRL